jgi:hypothetical protein
MSHLSKTPLPGAAYTGRMRLWIGLLASCIVLGQTGAGRLRWMAGCWSGQSGPIRFEEYWTRPAGGLMLGAARTLREGRVVFHEFMRIEERGGEVVYTPRIGSAEKPVAFRLVRQSESEVVFENPAHDFPQRILYTKSAEGLAARIEGTDKGSARTEDFPMRRMVCE